MAKILIADDEPAILELLRRTLELEGYEPSLASDGETALRRIKSEEPELVLLDVMMPVLDGWQVLEKIADVHARKRPRVIVLTAKGTERDIAKGLGLGACEYVIKPFEIADLLATIREVLARSDEEVDSHRDDLMARFSH